MKNKYNIGFEIFIINFILVAYILTSEGNLIANIVIGIISSLIAVIINAVSVTKNKNISNIVFLMLNLIILIGCIIYLIFTFI